MMNVLDYFNSRDVADHLKEIGFQFNAMQAAYVVYINDWLTIDERIELWQQIVDTMPDCEFQYTVNYSIKIEPSAHVAICEHIEKVKRDLDSFMANDPNEGSSVYIPVSGRWSKRPEWVCPRSVEEEAVGGSVRNTCIRAMPFSSFEKCVQYLKKKSNRYKRDGSWGRFKPFDRYCIGKTDIDDESATCFEESPDPEPLNYFLQMVTLNGDYEPIDIKMDWCGNVFENFVPEIPHPFEGGDILIDTTRSQALPFVFDRCVTWTLEDDKERAYEEKRTTWRNMDLEECDEAIGDRCSVSGSCYYAHGHMFAYGYEVSESSEEAILEYRWDGACDNYLNLEYSIGPFDGRLAILPTVSWFVMNEARSHPDFLNRESIASNRFKSRGIQCPNVATYDICSLANEGYKLG